MAFLADRGVNLDQVSFKSCYHEIEIVPRTLPCKSGARRIKDIDTCVYICRGLPCKYKSNLTLNLVTVELPPLVSVLLKEGNKE